MKNLFFFLLLAVISFGTFAQGPSKKCPTCGKSIAACQYKGRHPQRTNSTSAPKKPTTSKPKQEKETHQWVDLGLSVKWATCNVGANSPEEYGDYYAWGEVTTKLIYDKGSYKWGTDSYTLSKYNHIDKKKELDFSDDVVRLKWGNKWRIPTRLELEELVNRCKWTWTTINGQNGYEVKSKINGNSIFLPAAGTIRGEDDYYKVGEAGYFWSNERDDSANGAHCLCMYKIDEYPMDYWVMSSLPASFGCSVRPVTE